MKHTLEGFEETMLMYNSDLGELPWYAKKSVFWLFNFLLIGWVIRIAIVKNSQTVTFNVKKLILK